MTNREAGYACDDFNDYDDCDDRANGPGSGVLVHTGVLHVETSLHHLLLPSYDSCRTSSSISMPTARPRIVEWHHSASDKTKL
jgi:hypothetical protein